MKTRGKAPSMSLGWRSILHATMWFSWLGCAIASQYTLDTNFVSIQLNEGPMYASNNGPAGINGESFIELSIDAVRQPPHDIPTYLVVVCYTHGRNWKMIDGCADLSKDEIPGYQRSVFNFSANATTISAHTRCDIQSEGTQYIGLSHCDDLQGFLILTNSDVQVNGTLAFRNPFGWLPGSLFGDLPVMGIIASLSILMDFLFLYWFCRNRRSVIGLQWWILPVLLLTTAQAVAGFIGNAAANADGIPLCCPYRTLPLAAALLEIMVKAAARVLVLVVAMGYGIVRPKMEKMQVIAVAILGLLYLVSALQTRIKGLEKSGMKDSDPDDTWTFIELLTNTAFVSWIYVAIRHTILELKETAQDAKLKMYHRLFRAIIIYALVTAILAIVELYLFTHYDISWKWAWIPSLDHLLHFSIVAIVCIIWRPTPVSHLYAYSQQLPTSDGDLHADQHGTGIEMASYTPEKIKITLEEEDQKPTPAAFTISDEQSPRKANTTDAI